jgi:hypothetical protein
MPTPKLYNRENLAPIIEHYREKGSVQTALDLGMTRHQVDYAVRTAMEMGMDVQRRRPMQAAIKERIQRIEGRLHKELTDGYVLVGSDCHYFPGVVSTAHRAFVKLCKEIRPAVVVLNGDVFDGSTISRHPRIGWDSKPTVAQELKAVDECTGEIEDAAGTHELYWLLGNHDARYETFLAAHAPEFQNVDGFTLKSHFPAWKPGWSLFLNEDCVIKHRFKGGIHATHNNVLWAGRTTITGHLHSQRVTPLSDYNGTRWGVDCGTMAAPYGPQFQDYTEDNPKNWRSGFVLARYWRGRLLEPQTVTVLDEEAGLVRLGTGVFEV